MTMKDFVLKLREELTALTEKTDEMSGAITDVEKELSDLNEKVRLITELVNRVFDLEVAKAEAKEPQAVSDDGESWDPSLGPRPKRKSTAASAVAYQNRTVVKRRESNPKAASKDNR